MSRYPTIEEYAFHHAVKAVQSLRMSSLDMSKVFAMKRVGGLRFVRIGSLSLSYCFTKKR